MNRLVVFLCLLSTPALCVDRGQFEHVDPSIRSWFKSVRSPNGIPCCDVSDGHYTTWRPSQTSGFEFEVPIDDEWVPVPPETVIKGIPNPTGLAVVWYVRFNGMIHIRCFIIGDVS